MSSDIDFRIECLRLEIGDAAGYEHRIQPIAQRAAEVLAARLEQQEVASGAGRGSAEIESVSAPALSLDLSRTTDEQAANDIAAAWLNALAIHLEV
jgi:hypothetical protein